MRHISPKLCKFCHKSPKIYPLVTRSELKDVQKKYRNNIFKIQTERIEIPVFYTASCPTEKCNNRLHKLPHLIISEKTVNETIKKWNSQN